MSSNIAAQNLDAPVPEMKVPRMGIRWLVLIILLFAVVTVFVLELMIGAVQIPLSDVVRVLIGNEAEKAIWTRIVMDYRLPRALTAALAGGALGISGLLMQTLFRNPLASPWTLGLTAGAQLGVMIAVLISGFIGTSVFASLGIFSNLGLATAASFGTLFILIVILKISRRVNTITLLIIGLMFNYFASSVANVLLHFADDAQVKVFSNWEDGSFVNVTWIQFYILAATITVGILLAHLLVKPLNALLLGENYAQALGTSVAQARRWSFAATAILSGAVTAFCGPVAFLGVAIPHLCRGLFNTSDHRVLVPMVTLIGALTALTADLIVNLPWENHILHLNTVNALIGAPVVVWILLHQRNLRILE